MDVNKFREIIKQRENTDNEWDYGIEQCCKQEIENLSEDIPSTIEFLKNECMAGVVKKPSIGQIHSATV